MPVSFWTKCGKLITDGSNLLRCRTCPCGYYALLAFVGRSIDRPDGQPNYCYQPYLSIVPVEVVDGKINYLGDMGLYWSGCIQINVQPDANGRVGYVKGCADQWEECIQWDQNDNCIDWDTVYYDCYEIEVYRIGACYDNLEDFQEFVYSKCPQILPPYPALWQYWYGNRYTSQAAEECIYQNWDLNNDSWYSYAYYKYIPKASFEWTRYDNSLRIDVNSMIGHEQVIGQYTWCDGECRQYDANWNCIDCDGNLITENITQWVEDGYAHTIQQPSWGGSQIWSYTWSLCELQQGDPQCKCVNEYNSASAAGLSSLNDEIDNQLEDESNYWIGQQTSSTASCFNQSYTSRFEPNECWASWWVESIHRKACYYGKLKIQKWNPNVQYNGVHIRIYAVDTKGAGSGGDQSRYPLSVEHSTTVLYDTEMDAPWGTQITLPLANNMVNFSIDRAGYCNNLGDYEYIRFFPYSSACQNCETVQIRIEIMRTI